MKRGEIYHWSPTALEAIFTCPRQWYLNSVLKITNATMAMGVFIHRAIESLKLKRWVYKKGVYKSAEKWAGAMRGQWLHLHARKVEEENSIQGARIVWKDDDERFSAAGRIYAICRDAFDELVSEEPPIIFSRVNEEGKIKHSIEFGFRIKIGRRGISGRIDEIRTNLTLRDYKTGTWGYLERGCEYKLQPTVYALAYCTQCHLDAQFREKVGVSVEQAGEWGGKKVWISDAVKFHYRMLERKMQFTEVGKRVIIEQDPYIHTARTDFDFYELLELIDLAEILRVIIMDSRIFSPRRGDSCKRCIFEGEPCNGMTESFLERPTQTFIFTPDIQARLIAQCRRYEEPKFAQVVFDFLEKLPKNKIRR